jgi:CRP-like cAMP-binding protein
LPVSDIVLDESPSFTSNRILASLSPASYRRLRAGAQPVKLAYGEVLYEPASTIRFVYFPADCLVSLLTEVDKSRTLEVGMVGHEGMVGMPITLGVRTSAVRALVQGSGSALRMSAKGLLEELKANAPLQGALLRYQYLLMAQISQTAACNRFHEAGPRLARWLLMTSDRLRADEFRLTHEFLAHMLGVRRVGVTEAAGVLEADKLIEYSRGQIRILNRKRLEAAACSCYLIVQKLQRTVPA